MANLTVSSDIDALLSAADNAAARTSLGLGTLATQSGTFSGTSSGTNTGDQGSDLVSLMVFGDSISNGTLFSTYPYRYDSVSFAHLASILSGGAIHVVENKGVPGRVTTTLAANFSGDRGDRYPSHALIYCGVNDVSAGTATATTAANILSVVDYCIGCRIEPILCTVMPRDTIVSAERALLDALNSEIRYIAQVRRVTLVDLYARMVDPLTGKCKDGYTRDGLHPNEQGAKFIAEYLLESIGIAGRLYDSQNFAYDANDSRNLISNGLFSESSGAVTNWTKSGPGVLTVLDGDELIQGNWVEITQVSTSDTTTFTSDVAISAIAPGNRILFGGRIWTEILDVDRAGDGGVTVKVTFAGAAANAAIFSPVYIATESLPKNSAFSFEALVPSGATSATVSIVVEKISGSMRFAQFKLQNITTSIVSGALTEPDLIMGTRGVPQAIRTHNLTGNIGFGVTPNTTTTGPTLKTVRHAQFGNALSCGTLNAVASDTATTGSTEVNLKTNNVPANQLATNNDYLILSTCGVFAENANTKRIRGYLGASLLFDSGDLAANGGSWCLEIEVTRTGTATQLVKSRWLSSNSALPVTTQILTASATLSSANIIKLTGQGAADGDITQKTQMLRYYKAP